MSQGLTSNQIEEDQTRFCWFLYISAETPSEEEKVLKECIMPIIVKKILDEKKVGIQEKNH